MNTMELTVQLPQAEAHFLEDYARRHATTVADVVARYARRLERAGRLDPHSENLKFTGAIPAETDVREVYRQHIVEKHR